jgi:hypothetical protein
MKLAAFPEPTFDAAPILHILGQLEFRTARPTDQRGNPQVPHAYTVRSPENEQCYVALWNAVEAHGREERYNRRKKKYLYPGNGFKYWHMGALYQSRVINRMKIEDDLPRLIAEGQVEMPAPEPPPAPESAG